MLAYGITYCPVGSDIWNSKALISTRALLCLPFIVDTLRGKPFDARGLSS